MKAFVLNCFLMPIVLLAGIGALFSCTPATGPIVVNSSISVRSKTVDLMTLAWSQAQDTNGNNETLEYQVVVSESPDLETVNDVNRNARTVRSWEKNYTSVTIELNGTEQVFYYNVMVRDTVGTISFYSPLMVDFTDKTKPAVSDSTLTVSELTAKSLRLSWGPASDNNTEERDLVYIVMKSDRDNLTGEEAYYNNTEGRHTCFEKAGTFTFLLEALDPAATVWLNVFARDSNGNVTPYTAVQAVLLNAVTVTAAAEGSAVYTYPLSADNSVTLTLTANGEREEGLLPADSPLWETVIRWAATYTGNAVGQGIYTFENLYLPSEDTVSLSVLTETDQKLLANALTEYTNTYQSPAGNDSCRYLTETGAVARSASQAAALVESATATGFGILSDGSATGISVYRISAAR